MQRRAHQGGADMIQKKINQRKSQFAREYYKDFIRVFKYTVHAYISM